MHLFFSQINIRVHSQGIRHG